MDRDELIEKLLSLPEGMKVFVFFDAGTALPACEALSDIEEVVTDQQQFEMAFVIRPCTCHKIEEKYPIDTKTFLN